MVSFLSTVEMNPNDMYCRRKMPWKQAGKNFSNFFLTSNVQVLDGISTAFMCETKWTMAKIRTFLLKKRKKTQELKK